MANENLQYETGPATNTALYEFESDDQLHIPDNELVGRLANLEWRLNNLYWVINEQGELVKFKLRPAQRKLLEEIHYRNIILKARQLGFTTFICIFALDYALFHKNKQIGIIAHTEDDATIIFRKVKTAWDNFPKALKDKLGLATIGDSKTEYVFRNNSVMRISTSLRSGTYQLVLITEFGKIARRFPEKAEEIVSGTLPAVPATGIVFIESTAEGEEGRYYDIVTDAMELQELGRPLASKEFKFHFFPWYKNPANVSQMLVEVDPDTTEYLNWVENKVGITLNDHQRSWYYLEKRIQREKMKQEHPSFPEEAFASTGDKLFNTDTIDLMIGRLARDPISVQGDLRIWVPWQRGHVYGLAGDVSEGIGRDSSTAAVGDFTTGEVVATYRNNKIDPIAFAYELAKIGAMYGSCICAPEANNHGYATCVALKGIYPNIFTQVRQNILEDKATEKLGWATTPGSKPKMMYELSEAFESGDLKCYDKAVLLEAKKFSRDDTTVSRGTGTTRHFDLLTAVAILWQLRSFATRGHDPEQEEKIIQRRNAIEQKVPRKTHRYR